jgi:hypothetical protein
MVFRSETTARLIDSYGDVCAYFADVRSFFEVVETRIRTGEYGVRLRSVNGDCLFSSSTGHRVSDRDDGEHDTGACPAYVWFPTWLGGFYSADRRDADGVAISPPDSDVTLLAFVWTWIGRDDAHVLDAPGPECWVGIAQLHDERAELAQSLAMKIWRFFRFEWTRDEVVDGWLTGGFHRNSIGCDLTGRWYLQRHQLTALSSYYQVENLVVRPLAETFTRLASEAQCTPARTSGDLRV